MDGVGQELNGDCAAEFRILSFIDLTHAAAADLAGDAVMQEHLLRLRRTHKAPLRLIIFRVPNTLNESGRSAQSLGFSLELFREAFSTARRVFQNPCNEADGWSRLSRAGGGIISSRVPNR